jgi:molybdopterin converting factor small subunit
VERLTTVRYWAAIKEAAGVSEEKVAAPTMAVLLDELRRRHDERFAAVLARCSLLLDGKQVGTRDPASVPLRGGDEVDCLPPFAGG